MEYSLITILDQLDRLAPEWNALLTQSVVNVPFLRHEYLRAWFQTLGGGEWPSGELAIVTAQKNGGLAGIAPFFLTERDGEPILALLGGIEISDYLDLIARPEDLTAFMAGLFDFLAERARLPAWRGLELYNLPEESPTLAALQAETAKHGWACTIERFRPAVRVPLVGDFETYLSGIDKKQRHEIRRKMRRAEESGLGVRWYIVEDESTLDAEIDAFIALMANDHHKEEFLTEVMRTQMKKSVHAAFRAGWLQLAFLEAGGKKAAGYLNFDYDNHIWVYNSGLDFAFRELSPGWVLLGYLLQWANENGRHEFDFMRGDEDYKFKFGGIQRWVMKVMIRR
jgi:CelD/BcsL family acetyltransferase involved in cellulose biosynthesis